MTNKNSKAALAEFDIKARRYFESITRPVLHIPIYDDVKCSTGEFEIILPPKSCVILWIYEEYGLFKWIDIVFTKHNVIDEIANCDNNNVIKTQSYISYSCKCDSIIKMLQLDSNFCTDDRFRKYQLSCNMSFVCFAEKNLLINGLCSILRFMIKFVFMKLNLDESSINSSTSNIKMKSLQMLLGFRNSCLKACSEISVMTKFCEIDIFNGLEKSIQEFCMDKQELSTEMFRFEYHLRKPVKGHNIKKAMKNKSPLLHWHEFAEGFQMNLSDLIIYPCICIFQSLYGLQECQKYFPNTSTWYSKMNNRFFVSNKIKLNLTDVQQPSCETAFIVPQKVSEEESLYTCDQSGYNNPHSRLFTRQNVVVDALDSFRSRNITPIKITDVDVTSFLINWDEIPVLVHPEDLPASRRKRKCQQLESMTVEVMKVVEEKINKQNYNISSSTPLRIVDFCSGGGHVGILLAWLLPKCQIILVENKEESLLRAWERVVLLRLTNVLFYQCNLDYFDSQFEIGVALHACGSASDMVLSKCIAANASFVVSPCCVGSVQSNHPMLQYPRSCIFQDSGFSLKHYLILAHTADQTHDIITQNAKTEQGKFCMQVIDTDRLIHCRENGYIVYLKKMVPQTASVKNHILVGFSSIIKSSTTD